MIDTKQIEVVSLDEFTDEHRDESPPDLLKLDIQGAEYEVLKGGQSTLENVIGIDLEAHLRELYIGEPLFPITQSFLHDQDFRLISMEHHPSNFAGEVVELNLAYVRGINWLDTEERALKAVLFCVIHRNLEFATHLARNSCISDAAKVQILKILGKSRHPSKITSSGIAAEFARPW